MFATLIGPFPGTSAEAPSADPTSVAVTIADLGTAGLEPVSDGLGPRTTRSADDNAAILAAWRDASIGASRAVKQSVLGPFSAGRRAGVDSTAVAEAVGALAVDLAGAGCLMLEIDEPGAVAAALDPRSRAEFATALRRLTDTAAGTIHLSLVMTGGNVDGLGAGALFDLPFASYAFDLIGGPENWRLIAEAPGDRGIVCGALDSRDAADDRPEPLVWAAHYAASSGARGLARVGLANASSLASLTRARALGKVRALGEAARLASLEDPRELAALLDPRAVDIRSAATGRYSPRERD
jgi:hypothetical protein